MSDEPGIVSTVSGCDGGSQPYRRKIFGFHVSNLRGDDIVRALLEDAPPGTGMRIVVTANVDHVVTLRRNAEFRKAYEAAWLVTADGMPIYVYAKLMGLAVPEKVSGSDLFVALLPRLSPDRHRPVFLLPTAETGRWIEAALARGGFSSDRFLCVIPPFEFESDPVYSAALARKIADHGATHLFIGLGAPKSELWAFRHRHDLGDIYVLAIGASLEFAAGLKTRAPMWMRRSGLEWSWRLLSEPRRLGYRYLVRSWGMVPAAAADIASRGERVNLLRHDG